ncbi:MAG: PAS domain S-box protein [Candidatus Thorarchaeota archaeon]|nr:PAS domain S-box protein [Candidatus Thorarchaeota archaeon]
MVTTDYNDNELLKSTKTFEQVIDNSHEGIAIIGNNCHVEYVNDRICDILGRTHKEIVSHDIRDFIHQDHFPAQIDRSSSELCIDSQPMSFETIVIREPDEQRDVRISTCRPNNGERKTKILAQVLDITEEKRAKHALCECKMLYQTLIHTMNEGLGIIDDKGTITFTNAALCRMLGYYDGELSGAQSTDIFHGLSFDSVSDKIKERVAGKNGRYESTMIHKSGRLIPTMISASPLLDQNGEYEGSFAVFTDISHQKKAEKSVQATRDRAVLYLDIMRHDIRNQLQKIQVEAELLLDAQVDISVKHRLESILQAVSESSAIISETRGIEKLASLPLRERMLDEVLHECVMQAIILLDDVDFQLSIHLDEAKILADDYLEQLISDLLHETCQHNPHENKRLHMNLAETDTSYLLSITSNGPCMPDSVKKSLMGIGPRSGGLCFHLVQQIVCKYGSKIEVNDVTYDDDTVGSIIVVIFPKVHL